jgi:acyl carrier protein
MGTDSNRGHPLAPPVAAASFAGLNTIIEGETKYMQQQDIYAQLTTIFHDLFDDDSLALTPELTAADVPDWDSFNHINLIVAIESRFKIKFQTAELESMHTVSHLVDLIDKKLTAQGR